MAPKQQKSAISEMLSATFHPWANLRRLAGLDRLPDRRVSKTPQGSSYDSADPLRARGRAAAISRAMGLPIIEESRTELYQNAYEMDTDPLISTVLDAFGEDAGQLDPEHKRIVWVEAHNNAICKMVTETLDRLRIEARAFPILRSLARDGDVFMHVATARGKGVVAIRAYEPWGVARIEDDIGRLTGFAPSDERGNATQKDQSAVPDYSVLHFRLPPRNLSEKYGVRSSFLYGSRLVWRELQLMEDQVVIQRLLRRPDRLLILMDGAGMSYDEGWLTVKEWERRLSRETYVNPSAGNFQSHGLPLDNAKDLVLPRGPNNQTEIKALPATDVNDILRDVDMMLSRLAAGIGFPLGLTGRGNPASYQPGQTLSRQYQPFAKKATRLQRAFLEELTRLCLIDLAFKGLDIFNEANMFTLNMASVAPIVEIERAEVLQLRMDRVERAIALGNNARLNMSVWIPYVLEKFGGFPRDLIAQVYEQGKGALVPPPEAKIPVDRGLTIRYTERPDMQDNKNSNRNESMDSPEWRAVEQEIVDLMGDTLDKGPSISSKEVYLHSSEDWKQRGSLLAEDSHPDYLRDVHSPVADLVAAEQSIDIEVRKMRKERAMKRGALIEALSGLPVTEV